MAKSKSAVPAIDTFICFALYSASLSMMQHYKPLLQKLGVTYPQYLVLLVLWHQEGLGIKDIAERLNQDPGSITPLVKRLEALGYVNRARDKNDERNVIVTLTDEGKVLQEQSCLIRDAIADACGLGDSELAAMAESLIKLRKRLDA